MRSQLLIIGLSAGLLMSQSASALPTTFVQMSGFNCSTIGNSTDMSSGACGGAAGGFSGQAQAQARASVGSLGVAAIASSATNNNPTGGGDFSAVAVASFTDSLFFSNGPSEGFLRLNFKVDGSGALGVNDAFGSASFSLRANGANIVDAFSQVAPDFSVQGVSRGFDDTFSANLAYSGSSLSLSVTADASATCLFTSNIGGACSASASFFNTASIIGATLLDVNMNAVSSGLITSQSGFDYAKGVSAVPIPVIGPLFAIIILGLGFVGTRRSKTSP